MEFGLTWAKLDEMEYVTEAEKLGFTHLWVTDSGLIRYAEFHLNVRIFLYSFASILVFGLMSGVYPAWKMARTHPVNALKGSVK